MTRTIMNVTAMFLAAACTACSLPPMISDTGYRGTWSRGNVRNVSIVAIAEVEGRFVAGPEQVAHGLDLVAERTGQTGQPSE